MARHAPLRAELAAALAETRQRTLTLAAAVPEEMQRQRLHPFYSPFGWHVGHVGMTEAYWVLRCARGDPSFRPELAFLFANCPENPKENRVSLPSCAETRDYLASVRERVLDFLEVADFDAPDPLLNDAFCFRYVLAHEWQHQETLIELLYMMGQVAPLAAPSPLKVAESLNQVQSRSWEGEAPAEPPGFRLSPGQRLGRSLALPEPSRGQAGATGTEILIPAGEFLMGSDDPHAYDNERPAHRVFVPAFALDVATVKVADYLAFVEEGGYRRRELWDEAGWSWVAAGDATGPTHLGGSPFGRRVPTPEEPVCGVNWFEANAYARWKGKRLPTEKEWEKAAAWSPESGESCRFPWGDASPEPERADHDAARWWPSPVGSFPAGRSACGVLDMAGGVWEWTSSVFAPYDGFVAFPYEGYSKAHFDGSCQVLKGGSWATRGPLLRAAFRNFYPREYRQGFLGFRCARTL